MQKMSLMKKKMIFFIFFLFLTLCGNATATPWPSSCADSDSCSGAVCTFAGNFTVPAHETAIPKYAFAECAQLTGVVFEDGTQVTSIGSFAFQNSGLVGNFAWPLG